MASDFEHETMGASQSPKANRLPRPLIPLAFVGLGVYRAWIEITFVGSFVDYPATSFSSRDLFDLVAVVVMMALAINAGRIGPLHKNPPLMATCFIAMTLSTTGLFASIYLPQCAGMLGGAVAVLGGIGLGLIILAWSELYGCLNPLKVALYYSASLMVAALVVYMYKGFELPWLFTMTALMPLVTMWMLRRAYELLPQDAHPAAEPLRFSVPWKAVWLMALYALAYGAFEGSMYSEYFGPHSSPAVFIVSGLVLIAVLVRGQRFDFNVIYRLALPLAVVACLVVPIVSEKGSFLAGMFMSGGYTALSILTMLICANICYRYGASALWIFGIERSVRIVFMFLGRQLAGLAQVDLFSGLVNGSALVNAIALIAVMLGTFVLFSEKDLTGRWGATLREQPEQDVQVVARQALADRCAQLAREYRLTARESEVLLLLAQHKTVSEIEAELFIANGTAKAHVRHIYHKMDIHTRDELLELAEVTPATPASPTISSQATSVTPATSVTQASQAIPATSLTQAPPSATSPAEPKVAP